MSWKYALRFAATSRDERATCRQADVLIPFDGARRHVTCRGPADAWAVTKVARVVDFDPCDLSPPTPGPSRASSSSTSIVRAREWTPRPGSATVSAGPRGPTTTVSRVFAGCARAVRARDYDDLDVIRYAVDDLGVPIARTISHPRPFKRVRYPAAKFASDPSPVSSDAGLPRPFHTPSARAALKRVRFASGDALTSIRIFEP